MELNWRWNLLPLLLCSLASVSCAPRVTHMGPVEARPGTVISLSMEYLVGWPRVEISGNTMDWPQLKLMASKPERKDVPGEDLVWIEDKILQFTVPDLPPGDSVYAALETTAYVLFPPVWPYVFRSNQTQVMLRVMP